MYDQRLLRGQRSQKSIFSLTVVYGINIGHKIYILSIKVQHGIHEVCNKEQNYLCPTISSVLCSGLGRWGGQGEAEMNGVQETFY